MALRVALAVFPGEGRQFADDSAFEMQVESMDGYRFLEPVAIPQGAQAMGLRQDVDRVGFAGLEAHQRQEELPGLGVLPVDRRRVVGGIAGVVEAGALTATIAMFVGLFIYRTITWSNCKGAFVRAFRNSAMVFIIIAASGPFSWLLTSLGANQQLEAWLLGYAQDPMLFALVLVIFICLLGMVMDSAANIIVVGPVLVDVMVKAGYPDVQAALVVVVGFLIGSVTPPVGVAFFTAGAIAKARLESVALAMLPYLVALFGLLFLLIVIPDITMFLPKLMGFAQ